MQVRIEHISPRHAKDTWAFRDNAKLWEFMDCDTPLPATQRGDATYYKQMRDDPRCRMFAIVVGDMAVGCCQLHNIANGAAEMRYYVLDEDLWGRGICTKAVNKLVDYGFDELGLDLIYRYVNVRNVGSMRVAEKQKFAKVGISFINPEVVRLEMTRTGWERQRKNQSKTTK